MKYFIIAGERSGDEFAAGLVRELTAHDKECEVVGYGGEHMSRSGVHLLRNYSTFSSFGILSVLLKIRFYKNLIRDCVTAINDYKPDHLILVDFPGFNLQVAKRLSSFKITYCIPPKLWAWGAWRSSTLKRHVDHIHVIFPFEVDFYKSLGIDAFYIGNPSFRKCQPNWLKPSSSKQIAFLPGSRPGEVRRHMHLISRIAQAFPDYEFVVSKVPDLGPDLYSIAQHPTNVTISREDSIVIVKSSQVAIVASGTATLETALLNVPQVVTYKTNWLTYLVARYLLKTKHISLVNILLDKPLVKEFVQHRCSSAAIIAELNRLLSDTEYQKKISEGYSEISLLLGKSDPFKKSAQLIVNSH